MKGRRIVIVVVALVFASAVGVTAAGGQTATPPPNTFGLRLEGYAVETNNVTTATAVTPRTAYSYAKVSSFLDLDGSRGLDMEARGANDQYGGLGGAVVFSGDVPTDGNNLPGYAQAFFPTFEGFSQVSEKCAFNQTEAKETPECRDQDGPYAFARVVPDEDQPNATGIGRNQGDDDGRGDARSRSRVDPQPDGSIVGVQSNSGSDQGVPGTPITVDSYLAEQTVRTSLSGSSVDIRCEGEVSVNGQSVSDDRQLQQALAPLALTGDLRVEYEPPTEPVVTELAGDTFEATCRGPRFTVFSSAQGGTGTTYTFGRTFAAVGVTDNREPVGGDPGDGGFTPLGPSQPPEQSSASPPSAEATAPEPTTTSIPSPTAEDAPSTPASTAAPANEQASPELVREVIDTVPIGAFTGIAAGLLPLAVWLLLGVTGSLARGLPRLRLPPFPDDLA